MTKEEFNRKLGIVPKEVTMKEYLAEVAEENSVHTTYFG